MPWLNLAGPYGAMPQNPVVETLERHPVPVMVKDIIWNYYSNFCLRVFPGSHIRVVQAGENHGYTISVIPFDLATNFLVKATESRVGGPAIVHERACERHTSLTNSEELCKFECSHLF